MKVNLKAARGWYAAAIDEFSSRNMLQHQKYDAPCHRLEIFTRSVVALLLGTDIHSFPETFYLDYDRLRRLKAEIDNLVFLEICTDIFVLFAREFGSSSPTSFAIAELQTSIEDIMTESKSCSLQDWMTNSEAISLEILRQASFAAGQASTYFLKYLTDVNQQLRRFLSNRSTHHATRIENSLLPQVLHNVTRHATSSPTDLFINLVTMPCHAPQLLQNPPPSVPFSSANHVRSHVEPTKLTCLANRITHIILLHWRTWCYIAYDQDETVLRSSAHVAEDGDSTSPSIPQQPRHSSHSPLHSAKEAPQLMSTMKTGDLSDAGTETHIAHQTQFQ